MRRRPLILVVEDDRVLRELYRVALTLSNYAVHTSEDGLEALRFLETESPDVILLDLNLPRVPGTTLYEELRAHPQTRNVAIIVATGTYPVPYLPGATLLVKPISPDRLIRAVEQALRRRERTWLFSKGANTVRMALVSEDGKPARLVVDGPGPKSATYEESQVIDIVRRQASLERMLLDEGYQSLPEDRRSGYDRRASRRGHERRRMEN
jgi:DNA-binding response OmpR family regulator